jgi:hypothetical protein
MKYRWKKETNEWDDDTWKLYLILDGKKYLFALLTWYEHAENWDVFIAGFVCEEHVHVEKPYDLLCDAKRDVMDYAKVWWVTGVANRMNEEELMHWRAAS